MALTCEELNVQLNAQLQEALVGVVGKVKTYVDGKDAILKDELTEQIVKELTDIEGLGEDLAKIKEMADAFSAVFDENKDGAITPEEILAKAVLLQQAIDGVNGRLDGLSITVEDYKKALEDEIEGLKSRLSAVEVAVAQNRDGLANVKAELETNYTSKACVETMINIKVDELLSAVEAELNPSNDTDGDGATL